VSKVNKLNMVLLLLLGAALCGALAETNVNKLDGALLLLLGLATYGALVVVDEVFGRDSEIVHTVEGVVMGTAFGAIAGGACPLALGAVLGGLSGWLGSPTNRRPRWPGPSDTQSP